MNHVSATLIFSFIKTEFAFLPKCLIAADAYMHGCVCMFQDIKVVIIVKNVFFLATRNLPKKVNQNPQMYSTKFSFVISILAHYSTFCA
jgi:hypothetical protein